ncbi:MAG: peptidylprolyl isomerase [Bryobacteraceae bacterium]
MRIRPALSLCLIPLFTTALWCQTTPAPIVRFHTNLGDIDVTMIPSSAPKTVANFLNYMNKGAYNNSIFHRSVKGFIIQGGGFQLQNGSRVETPADPPVVNEYSVSNTRGTLAMAKLDGNPNSATNQWFFNLGNNATTLNGQNGGFTVFGRVANAASLAVMDKIAAVPIAAGALPSPYDEIPLINYTGGAVQDSNYVLVLSASVLTPPAIKSNGIVTASNFGGFASAAPGSFLEIYGSNLAGTTRQWGSDDFTNDFAPSSLDGVTVTIGGKPAYIAFVSPEQVNVQVPADVPVDSATPVVLTYKTQSSAPAGIAIKSLAPGLLAPPLFKVDDKQYVAAIHSSSKAFVSNGSIPDLPAAPAAPGETIIFYGVGFGPVSPASVPVAGRVVDSLTALSTPVDFKFGETSARIDYAGLIPPFVGVYQFNVVVPANTPDGDQPLTVILGSETVPQSLFIPVKK